MPPKKRKTARNSPATKETTPSNSHLLKNTERDRGLLLLPAELHSEILDNFLPVVSQTQVPPSGTPVLASIYLERTDVLRALSQVSVSYRKHFLPLLWQVLNMCFADEAAFYKHLGDTLVRKCKGLSQNPELLTFIR